MTPYEKKTLTYRFATFLVEHPFKSIALAGLLLAVLIPGVSKLQADFSYRIWFRETDPMLAKFDAFERRFGNDEMLAVAIDLPDGVFEPEAIELVQNITRDMWQVPEVIRVDSLTNYNWTHAETGPDGSDELVVEPLLDDQESYTPEEIANRKAVALNHEVIPGYLVSKDATATVIYAWLKPTIGGSPNFEEVVTGAREVAARYENPDHHTIYITGPAAVSHTFKEVTQADLKVMVPILLLAVAFFLWLSFRRLVGIVLPFFVIFSSIVAVLGFAGWIGIKFNNLTATVPHILVAISVADAVHILVTFFQFRSNGMERKQAAHQTLVKNLQPTLLTSVSTAIGFYSFASAQIIPIVYMGILAGTGTMIAWLITIFVLGPAMVHLPLKVKKKAQVVKPTEAHPLAVRYAAWLQRWRFQIIGGFILITIAAGYLAYQNEINSNPFKYFAENVPTRVANEFAEARIGGMLGMEVTINSGKPDGIKDPVFLKRVEAFQKWIDSLPHISKTIAITDIIKQTNRSLHGDDQGAYIIPDDQELVAQEIFLYTMSLPQNMDLNNRITLDNDMLRLTAMSSLHESKQSLIEIARVEAKAKELGLDAYVTGKMPLYHGMNPYVVNAFIRSISIALLLVSFLMLITFRSISLGLISMVPNLVPLVIGAGLMFVLGKDLDIGTVLVTSTCLGIAVDDTIHFLANYNTWRRLGVTREEAVAQVITHTGPALVVTTMVLVMAFTTFAFSSFVPNINFGIITAIVLSTALVTDGVLLPALLLCRGLFERKTVPLESAEAVS